MFRRHNNRRSTNIFFIIFRLILSILMLTVLLGGIYSAYKHFSGLDPLKLDPQAILKNTLAARTPQQLLTVLSSLKLTSGLSIPTAQKILPQPSIQPNTRNTFKFILVADSHNDNVNLKKALIQAKQTYPDLTFIIGLGDYTDVGTVTELKMAKKELDSTSLRYFLIPGDHDLWDSRDKQTEPITNFKSVFGLTYQSFTYSAVRFILLNNSDNYTGMADEQLKWLQIELEKAKQENESVFVFLHEPLFHPSSDHVMGRIEKSLKFQAKSLIHLLKDAGVKKVFAGDIHYFSEYEEPETKLAMVTVGAITAERNPQTPRFAIGYVFPDGTIKVEDVEIR